MSINVNDKNLGHATAYAYYKAGGGTMTEAEFTEFMADFGTASQTAVEAAQAALASKNAAQTAATTATNKATEATTAATTATNKAAEAQADADAAALDASQALSAASTATSKATEATTAAATATSAKTDAVAANTAAQSAKTAAQTAQTGAETAAASVQSSAAQIATNAADISQLKSELSDLEICPYIESKLIEDMPNVVSFDGYKMTIAPNSGNDGRNENLLYKFKLFSGRKYAIITDYVSTVSIKIQIYAPASQTFGYNQVLSANAFNEIIFTPSNTDSYTIKILNQRSAEQTINNFKIVDYEKWIAKNSGNVIPNFLSSYNDAQNINHALYHASFHNLGRVYVPYKTNGYILDESIQIYGNTELESGTGVKYTLADSVNAEMISNANISKTTAHTDANIVINGGIWDGNRDGQDKWVIDGSTKKKLVVGFLFVGVDRLVIKNVTIENARTYGCLINNSNDIDIHNSIVNVGDVSNQDNGDGIHVLGPANRIFIRNCELHSEDNVIAINADDVDHGDLITTTGNISDVEISDIYINNHDGGQGMLLLSATHKLENAKVNNIFGKGAYVLNLSTFGLGNGNYKNITVSNVDFSLLTETMHAFSVTGSVSQLSFNSIKINSIDWTVANQRKIFSIGRQDGTFYTNINELVIDGFFVSGNGNGKLLKLIEVHNNALVSSLVLTNAFSDQNTENCYLYPIIIDSATIFNLLIHSCSFNNMRAGIIDIESSNANLGTCFIDKIIQDAYSALKIYNPNNVTISEFASGTCVSPYYGVEIPNCIKSAISRTSYVRNQLPDEPLYFNAGDIIVSPTSNGIGYKCTKSGTRYTAYRTPSTAYTRGTVRKYGEYLLMCIASGTSSANDFDVYENTESKDGSCYWRVLFKGNAEFAEI